MKPATYDKYEQAIDRHIAPALGDYYVSELRPSDVAKFVADQASKLAGWTVINQLRLLRTLSKDAQAEGLTDRDFCARVVAPRAKEYTYDEPNLLSGEELGEMMACVTKQWRALVLVMATTGLRWGEVSALQWGDIDEASGVIHVRRNNWKGEVGEPKTIGSRRTVGLAPEVAEALREHRQRMMKKQHKGMEHGWIFPARRGELHTGSPLRRVLQEACAKAGIKKRLTAHGLRRTFNDLGRRVANREVVKSITGHTTDRMFEHYSLVGHDEKRAVATNVLRLALLKTPTGKSEQERGPAAPPAPEVEHPVEHRVEAAGNYRGAGRN